MSDNLTHHPLRNFKKTEFFSSLTVFRLSSCHESILYSPPGPVHCWTVLNSLLHGPGRVAERGQTNGTSSVKEGGNPKSICLHRVWYLVRFCTIHHQHYWSIFSPAGLCQLSLFPFAGPNQAQQETTPKQKHSRIMLWLSYFRVTISVPAARQKHCFFVTDWESKGYGATRM